ncbi:hypothetical protein FJY69_06065, partial [candidate division WOR-3 bacterium]|nr:hypothetical protein [candidate division WOR-3 bacterium]
MASPAQVVHARVEAWRPVLVGGGTVKEKCTAEGTGPDDFRAQIADTRMQNARVRKSPGKKFSVEVKPTELLG